MRKTLQLLTLLLIGCMGLKAQPISGTKTVGPTGDYANLTAAVAAIVTNTLSGPTILELQSAYTSTGETFPILLSGLTTTSTNTLTIRPEAAASGLSISASATATISLSGARYVTIDGRPGGTGTTKALTIANTLVTGNAIVYVNDASNNVIQHCTIKGVTTSASTGTILFSTTNGTTGNDDNLIDNCDILDGATTPTVSIYCSGSTTAGLENSGNTVSNCNIANFNSATVASCGILLAAGATGWTIADNRFYQTSTRTFTTTAVRRAISVVTGSGYTISGNIIGYSSATGTGVYTMNGAVTTTFAAINLTVGTTPVTSVQGNVITAINFTSTSTTGTVAGVFCGINVTAGNVNIGTTTGNVIGTATGVDDIHLTPGSAGALMGINTSSTGTVVIQNNVIGGLTAKGAAAATACAVHCINISGAAASLTITGNTIGGTAPASIRAGDPGITTANTLVTGINAASIAVTGNYSNNTIQNLFSAGTSTATYVRGIQTGTAASTTAVFTVNGNTIRSLSTNSAFTGASSGLMAAQGIHFFTGVNSTVSGNTIYDIQALNTAITNIIAAGIGCAQATNTTVASNVIYNISNAGAGTTATAPPVAAGIVIRSGTNSITLSNNMISLGTGQSTNTSFIGIWSNHGSAPDPADNIFHNTVNITDAASAGALPSFCYLRGDLSTTARLVTVNIKNNIFTNSRTGGTGKHYAIANNYGATASATGWAAGASDFNVLNADPVTVGYWGADLDLFNWRVNSAGDVNSFTAVPLNFVNPVNDLHLVMGTAPTVVESNGTPLASVSTDIDGQARPGPTGSVNGGAFAPDLGADEIDAVFLDGTVPAITYTNLFNTTSTSNRVLASVTITDNSSGIPLTGSLVPRIWYRRTLPTATAWVSTPGTLTSGTATSGTWSFTIDYSQLSITPVAGEKWEYYVAAQDVTGNVGFSPAAGGSHTNVNLQVTPPSPAASYLITPGLPTVISVGTGHPYTSLTSTGGLFELINNDVLTGNTTVTVTSDLLEDGTHGLNAAGLNGYTLTIVPSGTTPLVISNSQNLTTAMIRLNGVAGVTINGQSGGIGQYFRFVNTHTTPASAQPAIALSLGASNNTIRNIVVETNVSTIASGNIVIGSGTNLNNTILNCDIRDAAGTPGTIGTTTNGVYVAGGTNTFTIQDNNIHNCTGAGVNVTGAGNGCIVSGNSIYYDNATIPATVQAGITITGGDGHTISGNFIGGQAPNCGGAAWTNSGATAFTGILTSLGINTTTNISNNTIKNISKTSTGAASFSGINNVLGKVNIQSNTIGDPVAANSIVNAGSGTTLGIEPNNTESSVVTTVTGNTVANMSATGTGTAVRIRGISYLTAAANPLVASAQINNNTIFNLSTLSTSTGFTIDVLPAVGIMAFPNPSYPATPAQVNGNTIYNITAANTTVAVTTAAGIGATNYEGEIARNNIYNIRNYSTAPTTTRSVATGMFLRFAQNAFVHNNMIALGDDVANNVQITGIIIAGGGTATNFHNYFYNSVYLYNTTNAPTSSAAFQRGEPNASATVFPVTLTNNIFYNAITTPGNHFAIRNNTTVPATGWAQGASDNNLLYAVNPLQIGQWGATPYDFTSWQSNTLQDANSNSKTVSFVNATQGDLHLTGTSLGDYDLAGVYLPAFPLDFDNQQRNGSTPSGLPYMGADENLASPLPVTLLSFTARASENNSIINWKTGNEQNMLGYDVEASADGVNFTKIGSSVAKGDANVNEYSLTHMDAKKFASAKGVVYYRLKLTDHGGYYYSHTAVVNFDRNALTTFNIYPIPVKDVFYISVGNASGDYNYQVSDITGKVISKKSGSINGSSIWQADDLQYATSGTYFIAFSINGTLFHVKFTKQ